MKRILFFIPALLFFGMLKAQTITSATSGSWNVGATWVGGFVPTAADQVVIAPSHSITLTADGACRTLTIQNGATNGSLTINVAGTTLTVGDFNTGGGKDSVVIRGDFNMSNGALNIGGRLRQYAPGNYNQTGGFVRIDGNTGSAATSVADDQYLYQTPYSYFGGWTFTNATILFVDPTFGASGNTMVWGDAYMYLSATATIQMGDGVSTTAGGSSLGFVYDVYQNGFVVVNNPSGTNRMVTAPKMESATGINVAAGTFNITWGGTTTAFQLITNNGTITKPVGDLVAQQGVTNNGAISFGALGRGLYCGGLLLNNAGATITADAFFCAGNVTNNGTLTANLTFGLAYSFSSATPNAQTISGTGSFNFSNAQLLISNSNAAGITLNTSLSVDKIQIGGTAPAGNVFLGNNNVTFKTFQAQQFAANNSHFVANGTGRLRFTNLTTTEVLFPVGTGATFNPVSINNGSGHTFACGVKTGFTVAPPGTQHVNREWDIVDITGGAVSATVTLQWQAADEDPTFNRLACAVTHYTGGNWQFEGSLGAASGSNPYTKSATGVTSFSPFGVSSSLAVPAVAPTATTTAATSVTTTGATLNGTVNDNGATTTVSFEYGTSPTLSGATSIAATTGGTVSAGSGNTAAAVTVSGLTPGTTYYFRVNGANSAGTTNGNILSFATAAAASNDANLSNLTISAGTLTPAFAPGTTGYTASVANSVTSVDVTPTASNANATITVNGTTTASGTSRNVALNVGGNTITTIVTAQDGTTKTYTITITRAAAASNDANLSNLTISAGTLTPAFVSGTISYTASVSNGVTSVDVTPTASNANATITVNGTATASGTSGNVALNVGGNTITTVVTAQDGTTTKTYTITITRAAAATAPTATTTAATSITTSGATLNGTVNDNGATTTVSFEYGTSPTLSGATSIAATTGGTVSAGSGNTAAAVTVSGLTPGTTYYFRVNGTNSAGTTNGNILSFVTIAAASNDANLSNLTISSGTLTPAFASGTTVYTASVANSVTSVDVTPTASNANATITVNGTATASGTSRNVALNVGGNTITTVVTAQDGTTTKTYTITITRAAAATAPTATTTAATSITTTGATLNGTVNDNGATTTVSFEYGTSPTLSGATSIAATTGGTVNAGSGNTAAAVMVSGLTPGTTYYFRVNGSNSAGTTNGNILSFVTIAAASNDANLSNLTISSGTLTPAFASATTSYTASVANSATAVDVTPTASNANATITVNGTTTASGTSKNVALNVGSNTITTIVTAQDGTTTKTYTITITRAAAALAPTATTTAATSVTTSGGTLNGTVNDNGATTTVSFEYGTSPTLAGATSIAATTGGTVSAGSGNTATAVTVSGLTPGTTYYFRVNGSNSAGTTNGNILSFVTIAAASNDANLSNLTISSGTLTPSFAPATTSYTASVANSVTSVDVTPTASNANATITVNGTTTASGTSRNVALNVGGNTITIVVTAQDGTTTKTYTITITRAAAALAPTATTTAATSVTTSGATLNGTVNDNGATTTVSFEYGTSPTLSGATSIAATTGGTVNGGSGNTAAAVTVSGLTPGTTYYFRVTGANSAGTTNGNILSFVTGTADDTDIYCDKKHRDKKVYVCHNGNTICISLSAMQSHLNHGDKLGKCTATNTISRTKVQDLEVPETISTKVKGNILNSESFKMVVSPNPSTTDFHINVESISNERINIRVVDAAGRKMDNIYGIQKNSFVIFGKNYKAGIYFAEVVQGTNHKVIKLIKQ